MRPSRPSEPWRVVVRGAAVAGATTAQAALARRDGYLADGVSVAMEGHLGSAHLPVDVVSQVAVERALYLGTGDHHLVIIGEEVNRSVWVPPGGLVAVVDPMDGTAPGMHLGVGWSTVVMLYRLGSSGAWSLLSAAVAAGGAVATVDPEGRVATGAWDTPAASDRRAVLSPEVTAAGPVAVAIVGAKPKARKAFTRVVEQLPEAFVFNLGGTPIVDALLRGRLHGAVVPEPSTPWDAAHVLIAARAGATVVTVDGRNHDSDCVASWFDQPPLGDNYHTIPRCAVAADPQLASRLMAAAAADKPGTSNVA
jgi:fructose-1,6-bisphosphatase/inositol monophosphatase family enzyme